jgi:RNA polymerase sigma factor (sigma-70 family)
MLTQATATHYTGLVTSDSHTDEPLLTADAIARLVGNHREFLRFLERRTGNRAEAEDLLQTAFVKGVEHASSLRDDESVVAWFYRTLRNAVIDRHRRRGAEGRAMESFARELDVAVEPPEDVRGAVCQCVRSLSESLKPEYADALKRIDVDGLAVSQYAAEAGIQPNNAAVRVHRARGALRKAVLQSCGSCAEHGCLDCNCKH